jgi:hypothetical protein
LSSILRALKKIEKTVAQQEGSRAWPRPIDTKKTVRSRVKKIWLFNKLTSALVVFLIILAAGWLIVSRRQLIMAKLFPLKTSASLEQRLATTKDKESVFHAKIDNPSTIAAKTHPNNSISLGQPPDADSFQNNSPKSGSQRRLPLSGAPSRLKQLQDSAKSSASPKPKPLKTAATPTRTVVNRNQTSASGLAPKAESENKKSTGTSAQNQKQPATADRFSSLQRIVDSRLKLQAIAWFDDVGRRMAVINNRIVREGESVDGFSITQIRPDDVVVSDGTELWRLEFGPKP